MVYRLIAITVFLLCINISAATAQIFQGTVVDGETGEPIPYSNIFLTNTTLGVSADAEGNFSLEIPRGNYEVVTRMLGYEMVVFTLRTDELRPFYQIRLKPDTRQLREIKIVGKRDALWYRNLKIFKDHFLGTSANAQKCKILNPEVLILDSETEKGVLNARAVDALQISNPNLGYEIEYVLTHFKLDSTDNEVYFQGYPSYKNLKKYESRLPMRIVKNREKAYRGSIHHFLKSLYHGNSDKEGYLIREIKRVPNPDRPSDATIDSARVRMNETQDLAEKEMLYWTIISKERFSKTIAQPDSTYTDTSKFIKIREDGQVLLQFSYLLEVTYTKENEEWAYYKNWSTTSRPQKSLLRLNVPSTIINHQGTPYNPFDIFLQGYMGWEKMGDIMPIDYQP